MKSFQLGRFLRDSVSGFVGMASSRAEYLTGNIQYGLQPPATDGTVPDAICIDAHQLEAVPNERMVEAITPVAPHFDLGLKVKDVITDFEGLLVRRTTFLNGCVYYTIVKPAKGKEQAEEMFIDAGRLKKVNVGLSKQFSLSPEKAEKRPGGPNTRVMQRT